MTRYPQHARSIRCEYATARKWNARMAAGCLMDLPWDDHLDAFDALTVAVIAESKEWEESARVEWEETQRAHRTIIHMLYQIHSRA